MDDSYIQLADSDGKVRSVKNAEENKEASQFKIIKHNVRTLGFLSKPTCPTITFVNESTFLVFPCEALVVSVETFGTSAIVSLDGRWTAGMPDGNCIFLLPTSGQLLNVEQCDHKSDEDIAPFPDNRLPEYRPGFYMVPIASNSKTIHLKCQYLQNLICKKDEYSISIPLLFPSEAIAGSWNDVVSVHCIINAEVSDQDVKCISLYFRHAFFLSPQ